MDSFHDQSTQSSPEKVDDSVHNLLDEGWFFGKLLNTNPRMSRSYSDPSPRIGPEIMAVPSSTREISSSRNVRDHARAPSLQLCLGGGDQAERKGVEGKDGMRSRPVRRNSLQWTPSLPPCVRSEEDEDTEGDEISMSRLIRQAMPKTSEFLPPRHASNKIPTMPKYRPRNSESTNTARSSDQKQNQRTFRKSLSTVAELRRVLNDKDNEFDSNLTTTNTHQNRQEWLRNNQCQNRTCVAESWRPQSCAPPVPVWNTKDSAEDMKAQLKFWARAVASNVQ